MNSGFEDVALLLCGMLTGDWARDFAAFSAARKPHADAIADMAIENFIEMRDKVADRGIPSPARDRAGAAGPHAGKYLTRYQLVTFTRLPYRVAFQAGKVQASIRNEISLSRDFDLGVQLAEERLVPLLHG